MAARQNQSYLIWIIVLVILCLLLALIAFLGVQKALENADNRIQTENRLKQANALAEARQIQAQILRAFIGNMGDSVSEVSANLDAMDGIVARVADADRPSINEVIAQTRAAYEIYKKDMALLLTADGGENKPQPTYTELFNSFAAALKRKHDQNAVLQNDLTRIQRDAEAKVKSMEETVKQTEEKLAAAVRDYETEKTRRAEDVTRLEAAMAKMKQANDTINSEHERIRAQWEVREADLSRQVNELTSTNQSLKFKVNKYERENYDLADGAIVRVADGLGRVFINLGADDGLRNNRTFAVYNQGVSNFSKGQHKAMIEVVRILGPHQAECRITMEQNQNPILNGDPIVSPVWDRGDRVNIALAGIFDLDYDGVDDSEKLIRDIENNGGRVVCWHDREGRIKGQIDASTRYFVLGDAQPPGPDFNAAVARAARDMKSQAVQQSVDIIDTRKLLNMMGQHMNPVVERLDSEIGRNFMRRRAAEEAERAEQLQQGTPDR